MPDYDAIIKALGQTWPARLGQSMWDAAKLPGDVYQGNVSMYGDDGHTNPQVINRAADLAGMVTGGSYAAAPAVENGVGMGIRAYHGSPHDFDAFDLSKIGTGEGAQAYGHGLYFADREATAKSYRDALTDPVPTSNGRIQATGSGKFNVIDDFGVQAGPFDTKEAAQASMIKQPGHMYEVNINADPEHFLDWDKPLSQQPHVMQAVPGLKPEWTGGQAYESSKLVPGDFSNKVAASDALREAGIPGIKYLDQGSRAAGDGSRNYVVFNHDIIDILKKYGIALPAAAMAGASYPDGKS